MAASRKTAKSSGGSIPSWIIGLIVLAVAFVAWRAIAYVGASRATAPTMRNVAPAQVQNPAPPGTERQKMHDEK